MSRTGVDWERARARVRESEIALEETLAASPARIAAVFRARAERLAKRDARQASMPAGVAVLVFYLGQDRYAIELGKVAEALRFDGCEPAPGSPPLWSGVMNVRGELRAVMDLARLLAPSGAAAAESGFVLMLRSSAAAIGLRVDSIEGVRQIRPEELDQARPGRYIKAVTGGLMLLDLQAVSEEAFGSEESTDI